MIAENSRYADAFRKSRETSSPLPKVSIAPSTSLFLDALRLFAALGVVFAHLGNSHLAPSADALRSYGGFFVVIFFVLSGYVIAATTECGITDPVRYFSVRLARLWPVAIPSLLLAWALEKTGNTLVPHFFGQFDRGYSFLRYGLAATFTNELWLASAGPPMDLPVWSLAYEFWYYVIFGIAVFVRKPLLRMLGLLAAAILIGPKILVLFPIWLVGVFVWRLHRHRRCVTSTGWGGIVGSVCVLTGMVCFNPHWPGEVGHPPWFMSAAWLSDGLFSLGVGGLVWGVGAVTRTCRLPRLFELCIRKGAGVSFSLYLLHFPLMVFSAGVLPYNPSSPLHVGLILICIFVLIYGFGSFFEPLRKPLAFKLEKAIRRGLEWFGGQRQRTQSLVATDGLPPKTVGDRNTI